MRQAYDYWQDQPGISPWKLRNEKEKRFPNSPPVRGTELSALPFVSTDTGVGSQPTTLPVRIWKNLLRSRVARTRRVKPIKTQYRSGRSNPWLHLAVADSYPRCLSDEADTLTPRVAQSHCCASTTPHRDGEKFESEKKTESSKQASQPHRTTLLQLAGRTALLRRRLASPSSPFSQTLVFPSRRPNGI